MKIGLFGGSFNPPHQGHRWLADQFRRLGHLDMVWVLVAPSPPHKEDSGLVAYPHRLAMARLAFDGMFGVEVNTVEESLPAPHYTVNTVDVLKKRHSGTDFYLCIGEDSLESLAHWHQPERLLEMVHVVVARREGASGRGAQAVVSEGRIRFIEAPLFDASSTDIRWRVRQGLDIAGKVHPEVEAYIQKNRLYRA